MEEDRLKVIEGRVTRFEDDLERLTRAMVGDGTDLAPGVVGVLDRHTNTLRGHGTRIAENELFRARVKWTVTIAASLGSAVGGAVVFAISHLVGVR